MPTHLDYANGNGHTRYVGVALQVYIQELEDEIKFLLSVYNIKAV